MEGKPFAVGAAGDVELAQERVGADAYAHRREFERGVEDVVVEEHVAVESAVAVGIFGDPVVVVGCASVVGLAVGEGGADADDKDGSVAADGLEFALFRRQRGVGLEQLLGMDEGDVFRQARRDVREIFIDHQLGGFDGLVNFSDDVFEEADVAVGVGDGALPVPLVNVERVEVVEVFVGADGVHVGVEPEAGGDVVEAELHALPFGERVDDLGALAVEGADIERNGFLDAVEVVVDACAREDKERGRDATEAERVGEAFLKIFLDELDGDFGCFGKKLAFIAFWYGKRHYF